MIRDAVLTDAPDLARVHVASWQKAYRGLIAQDFLDSLDVAQRTERWKHLLRQRRGKILVAVVRGATVGFCAVGPALDAGWGEVYSLYVDPANWGTGQGRDLLAAGEEALADDDHGRAMLWVLETNRRARTFYERQGWQPARPIRIENIGGIDVTEVRYEKLLGRP